MIASARILHNYPVTPTVMAMDLQLPESLQVHPGQFAQIQVPGFFLRRPISISSVDGNVMHILYKVVGAGTSYMEAMQAGDTLNVFAPLGHGFSTEYEKPLLIGGGVGVPPLYELARCYVQKGIQPVVVLGFNTAQEIFLEEAFQKLGCAVYIATMDGSFGTKGTVLDVLLANHLQGTIQACGPLPMLKALQTTGLPGEISLEARMACGMGACMGCVVKTFDGQSRRVCKDGPVFDIQEVEL